MFCTKPTETNFGVASVDMSNTHTNTSSIYFFFRCTYSENQNNVYCIVGLVRFLCYSHRQCLLYLLVVVLKFTI